MWQLVLFAIYLIPFIICYILSYCVEIMTRSPADKIITEELITFYSNLCASHFIHANSLSTSSKDMLNSDTVKLNKCNLIVWNTSLLVFTED